MHRNGEIVGLALDVSPSWGDVRGGYLVTVFNTSTGQADYVRTAAAPDIKPYDIVSYPPHPRKDRPSDQEAVPLTRLAKPDFTSDEWAYLDTAARTLRSEKQMIHDTFGANGKIGYARAYLVLTFCKVTGRKPATSRDLKPYSPR